MDAQGRSFPAELNSGPQSQILNSSSFQSLCHCHSCPATCIWCWRWELLSSLGEPSDHSKSLLLNLVLFFIAPETEPFLGLINIEINITKKYPQLGLGLGLVRVNFNIEINTTEKYPQWSSGPLHHSPCYQSNLQKQGKYS